MRGGKVDDGSSDFVICADTQMAPLKWWIEGEEAILRGVNGDDDSSKVIVRRHAEEVRMGG